MQSGKIMKLGIHVHLNYWVTYIYFEKISQTAKTTLNTVFPRQELLNRYLLETCKLTLFFEIWRQK